MAEAVIFAGLQGAGKTTYYRQHFAGTHVHVSRDLQGTRTREGALVAECLRDGRSYVVNNTNSTRAARASYLSPAKAAGYRVVCVYFDVPIKTAIARNKARGDKQPIPAPGIFATAKRFERPSMEEGFDEIRTVS